MATYKVIQDIEAEDKLLGPFSLRQFIYLIIVAVSLFICYRLVLVQWFLVLPFVPVIIFFGLLAAPLGGNQSSEVWLLAKIRFFIKPKKRIWDQSGIKNLVTITAPKKIERILTNNLSQAEVRSRLSALASTIDSRGWAVKNVNVNMFAQPAYAPIDAGSDRLLSPTMAPVSTVASDVQAADDILDERSNPTAQALDQKIQASTQAHHNQLVARMQQASQPAVTTGASGPTPQPDYWFLNEPAGPVVHPDQPQPFAGTTFQDNSVVAPTTAPPPVNTPLPPPPPTPLSEQELLEQLRSRHKSMPQSFNHMRIIQPTDKQHQVPIAGPGPLPVPSLPPPPPPPPAPVTPPTDPAILELANNDDLNVATIARQANKAKGVQGPNDEVVISLH